MGRGDWSQTKSTPGTLRPALGSAPARGPLGPVAHFPLQSCLAPGLDQTPHLIPTDSFLPIRIVSLSPPPSLLYPSPWFHREAQLRQGSSVPGPYLNPFLLSPVQGRSALCPPTCRLSHTGGTCAHADRHTRHTDLLTETMEARKDVCTLTDRG